MSEPKDVFAPCCYTKAYLQIVNYPGLADGPKLTYIALTNGRRLRADPNATRVSIKQLALWRGIKMGTVRDHLKLLVDAGFIERQTNGYHRVSITRFLPHAQLYAGCLTREGREKRDARLQREGAENSTVSSGPANAPQTQHQPLNKTLGTETKEVQPAVTLPIKTETRPFPPEESQYESRSKNLNTDDATKWKPTFDDFMRHNNPTQFAEARRLWERLPLADMRAAFEQSRRLHFCWRNASTSAFRVGPERFLRERRWENPEYDFALARRNHGEFELDLDEYSEWLRSTGEPAIFAEDEQPSFRG